MEIKSLISDVGESRHLHFILLENLVFTFKLSCSSFFVTNQPLLNQFSQDRTKDYMILKMDPIIKKPTLRAYYLSDDCGEPLMKDFIVQIKNRNDFMSTSNITNFPTLSFDFYHMKDVTQRTTFHHQLKLPDIGNKIFISAIDNIEIHFSSSIPIIRGRIKEIVTLV
ncbi:MAG: hypothetical protein ACRYGG_03830 [Janthinobacterium lividum]